MFWTRAATALSRYGLDSGGTRNIGGNNDTIVELESELADLHNKESALIFTQVMLLMILL